LKKAQFTPPLLVHRSLQLDHRLTKRGNATVTQVPVKWNSLAEELATWEDYYVVRERFPLAPAWGQAKFQGGGSVTTDIV
jgi:hypothetical protein